MNGSATRMDAAARMDATGGLTSSAGDTSADALEQLTATLLTALGRLDPTTLTPGACARLATTLSRAANACTAAAARCTTRAPEPSAGRAEWLARISGTTTDQARRALEVVASVPASSPTGSALADGEVSVAQAAAIVSAPGHEADLLDTARNGSLRAVRDAAREHRLASVEPERLAAQQSAARSLTHWKDDLGMVCFRGALPPVEGTIFVNRLDALTDRLSRAAWRATRTGRTPQSERSRRAAQPTEGTVDPEPHPEPEPRAAYAADALLQLLSDDTTEPISPRRREVELVVIADVTALQRGQAEPGEACRILGGGPLPVSTVRELAADAFIKVVLHDGTRIHTVAHYGRNRPAHLRTALMLGPAPRFPGTVCAHPGCERRHHLEWDHIQPFARGGPTSFANLQPLCPAHHREKSRVDSRTPSRAGP